MANKKGVKKQTESRKGNNTGVLIGVTLVAVFLIAVVVFFSIQKTSSSEYQPLDNSKAGISTSSADSTRPAPVLQGYAFDVGSMWLYETLDNTLTVKVTDKYRENNQDIYIYTFFYGSQKIAEEHRIVTKDYMAKVKSVQGDSTITVFKKPLILYKFPMKVGDKWVNEFEISGVQFVSEVEVVSYEKVKTKGGVFMAYKIKHTTYPKGEKKSASVDADWFNPRIGLIAYAKKDGENPKALIKYNVRLIEK